MGRHLELSGIGYDEQPQIPRNGILGKEVQIDPKREGKEVENLRK